MLNYDRSEALRQAMYVYDAVWAAALALDATSAQLQSGVLGNVSLMLEDFNYARNDINQVIFEAASRLNFRGVSVSSFVYCVSAMERQGLSAVASMWPWYMVLLNSIG